MVNKSIIFSAGLLFTTVAQAAPLSINNAGFEDPYLGGNLPAVYNGDVPATAFPVGLAPDGWGPHGAVGGNASIGVLNPGTLVDDGGTFFPEGAAEGDNVALTFFNHFAGGAEFGIEQTLTATLQPNTFYSLSVEIGNIASGTSSVEPFASFGFFDIRGFPGYRVELFVGEEVIAQDNNSLLPNEGEFLTSVVTISIPDSQALQGQLLETLLGQPLGIRLVNLNQQDLNDPVVTLEVDFDDVRLDAIAIPAVPGDINDDGNVDVIDVLLATRIALCSFTPTADQLFRGDVVPQPGGVPAPDGVINAGDLVVIMNIALSS